MTNVTFIPGRFYRTRSGALVKVLEYRQGLEALAGIRYKSGQKPARTYWHPDGTYDATPCHPMDLDCTEVLPTAGEIEEFGLHVQINPTGQDELSPKKRAGAIAAAVRLCRSRHSPDSEAFVVALTTLLISNDLDRIVLEKTNERKI